MRLAIFLLLVLIPMNLLSYKSQPIIPFDERIALVKALKYPDIVIPQRSLDHTEKVKKLHFDVFVVGDDWTGKYDYLEALGVSVVYFPYRKRRRLHQRNSPVSRKKYLHTCCRRNK